jgi:hypothetical protein
MGGAHWGRSLAGMVPSLSAAVPLEMGVDPNPPKIGTVHRHGLSAAVPPEN